MSDWVRPVAGERDSPVLDEHRARDDPVRQVVAPCQPRVVEHEHVAGLDVVLEVAQHRAHRESAAAGVDRDAIGLGDQPAVRPAHEAGEVVGLTEDGAARGAHHHVAHLPGDVVQAVLGERELYGVEGHGVVFDVTAGCPQPHCRSDSDSWNLAPGSTAQVDAVWSSLQFVRNRTAASYRQPAHITVEVCEGSRTLDPRTQ